MTTPRGSPRPAAGVSNQGAPSAPRRRHVRSLLSVLVALALVNVASGQTADEKKATLAYLVKLRADNGGYRPDAKAELPTLRGTSSCLRAIKYFGGKPEK